jgi:hypothetical protein
MAVNDSEQAMTGFTSEGGWTFPVMVDVDRAAGAYGVRPIPTLFVIDGEGFIVKTIVGEVSAQELSALVHDLTR